MYETRFSLSAPPLRILMALALGLSALVLAPTDSTAQANAITSRPLDVELAPLTGAEVALAPDGLPVVAYLIDDSGPFRPLRHELQLAKCADRECTDTADPQHVRVVTDTREDGLFEVTDLVVTEAGNPVISVQAGGVAYPIPYVVFCDDPACTSRQTHRAPFERPEFVSDLVLLPNGAVRQVLSDSFEITVADCTTEGCTVHASEPLLANVNGDKFVLDFAVDADGSTVIASFDFTDQVLSLRVCDDGSCDIRSTVAAPIALSVNDANDAGFDDNSFGSFLDMDFDNRGNLFAAFVTGDVLACNDPLCEGGDDRLTRPDPAARAEGRDVTLLLRGDEPPIIVLDYNGPRLGSLRVLTCTDAECSAATTNRVAPEAQRLRAERLKSDALLSEGDRPLVVYNEFGLERSLAASRCANASCGSVSTCDGFAVTVDLAEGQAPTDGPDVILGSDGDDVIAAGGGDDVICGLAGDDSIWGQDGDDMVFGHEGADRLRGGAGDDAIVGGPGSDNAAGGPGDDLVEGSAGDDEALRGGTGDDAVHGGDGDDALVSGNGGTDRVFGNAGDDWLFGGPRDDRLVGSQGNDLLKGNGGADELVGSSGDDQLFGGPGSDRLDGGQDTDMCNGGTSGPGAIESDAAIDCESEVLVP